MAAANRQATSNHREERYRTRLRDRSKGRSQIGAEIGHSAGGRLSWKRLVVMLRHRDQIRKAHSAIVVKITIGPLNACARLIVMLSDGDEIRKTHRAVEV